MEVKVWLLSAVMIVVFLFKRSPRNANVVCLSVIPHYSVKLLSQPRVKPKVSQESAKSLPRTLKELPLEPPKIIALGAKALVVLV